MRHLSWKSLPTVTAPMAMLKDPTWFFLTSHSDSHEFLPGPGIVGTRMEAPYHESKSSTPILFHKCASGPVSANSRRAQLQKCLEDLWHLGERMPLVIGVQLKCNSDVEGTSERRQES